ncbi:MAG: J domain-containing protein [Alphaproteobacteria bacterium]|nr:J domain-containing protein [Alphaproteobacteria bacterium]
MNKNPYEILGVAKDANEADIKKAYHKLVMKYHPDKNPGDKSAEEKFKEVNNAFEILKDPQKRAAYDQFGSAAFAGGNGASAGGNPFGNMGGGEFHFNMGGGNMEDILREAMKSFGFAGGMDDFGMGGGARGARAEASHAGRDLLHDVVISLRDAYFGKMETIKFTTNVACEKCGGHGTADAKEAPICKTCRGGGTVRSRRGLFLSESVCPDCQGLGRKISKKCQACEGLGVVGKRREIKVEIPAGVSDGTRLRLRGQGEAGILGGPTGDFYVDIHIQPDQRFERFGEDLLMRKAIPFATLALGGEIEVETIDDKKISVKIPAGTQIGERLRVRGRGMPSGDLYIEIATEIPTKLTDKQKKALEEFAGSTGKKKRGWL